MDPLSIVGAAPKHQKSIDGQPKQAWRGLKLGGYMLASAKTDISLYRGGGFGRRTVQGGMDAVCSSVRTAAEDDVPIGGPRRARILNKEVEIR